MTASLPRGYLAGVEPEAGGWLDAALGEIARLGGGTVESYPADTEGRSVSGSFLHDGPLALFGSQGFERTRRLGKHRWVVTRVGPVGPPARSG